MKTESRAAVAIWIFLCAAAPLAGLRGRRGALPASPAAQNAQQAIIQLEHRWLANENNGDALNSILADDFVHVLPQGFISKQEQTAFLRAHPQQQRLAKHEFEKLDVRVYGSVAIANGIVLAMPSGTASPQRTLFTDVFAFRKGRWQAVNAQETPAADAEQRK